MQDDIMVLTKNHLLATLSFIIIFQHLCTNTSTSNLAFLIASQNDPQQSPQSPLQTQSSPQCTLQVIHGLSGNKSDFMDEWEVNLKSLLFNAPLDCNMHLHIVADAPAATEVHARIMNTPLFMSRWRNEITVTVHNIEERMEGWKTHLLDLVDGNLDYSVTIGAFFRLFANGVIKEYWEEKNSNATNSGTSLEMDNHKFGIDWTLYMDPDLVILSNLNHLIETVNGIYDERRTNNLEPPLFVWNGNSGFMTMNYATFDTKFWEILESMESLKEKNVWSKGDQGLLEDLAQKHPDIFGVMPDDWSTHMGHGFFFAPQELFDKQKRNAGFVHFTGDYAGTYYSGKNGLLRFCSRGKGCQDSDPGHVDKFQSTWGLADYFVRISWDWVIYQGGKSRIRKGEEGYAFDYEERTVRKVD